MLARMPVDRGVAGRRTRGAPASRLMPASGARRVAGTARGNPAPGHRIPPLATAQGRAAWVGGCGDAAGGTVARIREQRLTAGGGAHRAGEWRVERRRAAGGVRDGPRAGRRCARPHRLRSSAPVIGPRPERAAGRCMGAQLRVCSRAPATVTGAR